MAPEATKSTIGRTRWDGRLMAVRAAFRTLDLVAPGLAARWATRLWCTPAPPGGRRRPDPPAPPGERFLTSLATSPEWASRPVWRPGGGRQLAVPVAGRWRRGRLRVGGSRGGERVAPGGMVVAEVWGTGPTTTYLLHGWGGRRGQLAALVEPLVAAGQRVVAVDAPGHGESGPGRLGGRRTTLVEFAEALAAVVAVTGPAHAVVAHSAGANAAVLAVRDGLAVDRLVFVAPMADPLPYIGWFAQVTGVGRRTRPRFLRRVEQVAGRAFAEFDQPARVAEAGDRRWPALLVLHDRADREIRHRDGQRLAGGWPGARLVSTEGLGHRRLLAAPEVIDATVAFVTAEPPAPAPAAVRAQSGAAVSVTAAAAGSSRRS